MGTYSIPTGVADCSRANSINQLFDPHSLNFFPFDKVKEGAKILFAGSGNGVLVVEIAKRLKDRNVKIVAMDFKADQLKCGSEYAETEGVQNIAWVEKDIRHLDDYQDFFDIVHVRFVLCNTDEPKLATNELCNALVEDGIFIGEELSGNQAQTSCPSIEHSRAMTAWAQAITLQHANQKSDIRFAGRLSKVLGKIGMIVEEKFEPKPIASTPAKKHVFPEGFVAVANRVISAMYAPAFRGIHQQLLNVRDCQHCNIEIPDFVQIRARKPILSDF